MKERLINILLILIIIICAETTFLTIKPSMRFFVHKDFLAKDSGGMEIQKRLAEEYLNQGLRGKAKDIVIYEDQFNGE